MPQRSVTILSFVIAVVALVVAVFALVQDPETEDPNWARNAARRAAPEASSPSGSPTPLGGDSDGKYTPGDWYLGMTDFLVNKNIASAMPAYTYRNSLSITLPDFSEEVSIGEVPFEWRSARDQYLEVLWVCPTKSVDFVEYEKKTWFGIDWLAADEIELLEDYPIPTLYLRRNHLTAQYHITWPVNPQFSYVEGDTSGVLIPLEFALPIGSHDYHWGSEAGQAGIGSKAVTRVDATVVIIDNELGQSHTAHITAYLSILPTQLGQLEDRNCSVTYTIERSYF